MSIAQAAEGHLPEPPAPDVPARAGPTQRPVRIERLATGVPGLDEVLGGGLPTHSFNLIAGQPGCGKTTLAHQMMFALATPARRAIYFTALGEPALKMLRYQQQFDFFDGEAIGQRLDYISLAEEAVGGDLGQVLGRILFELARLQPAYVFVDSFRSVILAGTDGKGQQARLQHFMQELGMLMASWQVTTFLLGEFVEDTEADPVMAIADGLIWLRQAVQRNSMVRKLEVLKMRGQPTLPGLHSFRIGPAGIQVFAPARKLDVTAVAPASERPMATRLGLGVAELDHMLGGGLPRGYSLLVAGPSGSGKSILAASFLAEGARLGETGVVAAFEQQPTPLRNRVLADLIASGQVGLIDSQAPDLSMDEVVLLIINEVRRLGASRVVLDSLSGFELLLAPSFQPEFRESLQRLVASLARAGVTVVMTSELEDRYTDLRFSPYGAAFLTDAIVVQRYIEVDSRLLRVMAVVKLRASGHSDELRTYTINDAGISVGQRLVDHEGLLGGSPSRGGSATSDQPGSGAAAPA